MGNNMKKSKDPTEVALSAIQDALDTRAPESKPNLTAQREQIRSSTDEDLFIESPGAAAASREERPARLKSSTVAANDDRANIGHVLQSLQRRPSRTPYTVAGVFSAAWVICALGLSYSYEGAFASLVAQGGTAIPLLVGLTAGFFAPVVFFMVIAHMLARTQELRMISQSMAEVAVRLAEPETVARESIVSVGQAIRREVAAMGDGVERALARAAELEALVNNEVTALERAYNDNELRIRTLLDGLASQRETLVGQAEQVRTAITNVHLDLSHDITSVSEAVAERVNEAAQRIARTLAEKGEHITVALGHAGDSMIDALGERGGDLLDRLERTSRETTHAIETASDRLTSSLNFKTDHLNEEFVEIATNMQQMMSSRLDRVADGFAQKSASIVDLMETRSRALTQTIVETSSQLAETIATRADEVNSTLKSTGDSIVLDLSLRGGDVVSKLEQTGLRITDTIISRGGDVVSKLEETGVQITDTINSRGEKVTHAFSETAEGLAGTIETRSDAIREMLAHRLQAFEEMFNHGGAELAERIGRDSTTLGNLITRHVAEFDRTVRTYGGELVERLGQRTNDLNEAMRTYLDGFEGRVGSKAVEITTSLDQRLTRFQEALDSRTQSLGDALSSRVVDIAKTVAEGGNEVVAALDKRIIDVTTTISTRGGELAATLGARINDIDQALGARATQVADNLDSRISKFEDLLIGRADTVTREIETRSKTAVELLSGRMEQLSQSIKTNTGEATHTLETLTTFATKAIRASANEAERTVTGAASASSESMRSAAGDIERSLTSLSSGVSNVLRQNAEEIERAVTDAASASSESMRSTASDVERSLTSLSSGVTNVLKQNAEEIERTLLGVSSEVARDFVGRADEIAAAVGKRSDELTKLLDEKSSGLLAAISTRTTEFAVQVGNATDAAVETIRTRGFTFAGTMMENSNELARIINEASTIASDSVNRTIQDLSEKTQTAIEQSRQTATVTVAEMLETHGMLRSDTTTMFERLREANGLLQEVLSGAQDNLSSIEHMLSSRVTEFVATMNQLLERTGETTTKMDDHMGSFYGLTTKTLHDLTELTTQFDGYARGLAQAVDAMETSNLRGDETLGARRAALETVVAGLDARTEELDARLRRFSGLLEESLAAAEARARDIARVVADATAESARAIAEQHDAVRVTAEQERIRTADSLRTLYEQATSDSQRMFRANAGDAQNMLQQAKDRFAEVVGGVKQMAAEMQRELDATRQELRRGILELPQETAESASQMRRVIVDQIEALAELNRIVARHGRGMDAQQPESARRASPDEAVVVSMGGGRGARSAPRPDITSPSPPPMSPPMPSPASAFAPRRSESPSLSPPQAPAAPNGSGLPAGGPAGPGGRAGGWLTDLLSRASRETDGMRDDDRPPMRPDDRAARHSIESLDSLSVDIARMIDHNAASDLWDRYNRGERNVFTKRLYTLQGQKAFDEITKRYRADREFKQTVDRYIDEFERLLDEVSRDDRGDMVARSYLTSETGKVYTMLAHAAGRFD